MAPRDKGLKPLQGSTSPEKLQTAKGIPVVVCAAQRKPKFLGPFRDAQNVVNSPVPGTAGFFFSQGVFN